MAESILTRARPLMVARLAGAAITFGVPMVLARALVPAEYGTFKQAWLLSQTLALVLPLGLTQSLYYFVPREPGAADRFVAQTLWATAALGALGAALVLAGGPLLAARFENPELARALPWVAAFTAFTIAGSPLDIAWNASGRVGAAALVRVGTEAARGAGMVAGALALRSVDGVLAGIAVATGLRAAVAWLALARRHGVRGDGAALRRQLAYALPFGLAFLAVIPQQQFHQYAVAAAVPAAAFAVYSVGVFQLPVIDILYTPVSELLQIGLAESDRDGRGARGGLALFHEAVLQLSFAFVPILGLLAVVAPELIAFVFSARYLDAVPIFRVSVLSVALATLPLDGVMRARAQNRFMLALSVGKLALTLPLVLGGLRWLGPIGALGGWIAAESVARAAMLARAAALFDARAREILPLRPLARQVAATLVAMPAAWLAVRAAGRPLAGLTVAGLAFGAAYLGICWARGWLPAGWAGILRRRRVARPAAAPGET